MLEKLLKKGILLEKEGRIKLAKGNEFTLSTDVLRQHIPRYLDFYSCDRNFQQKNFIHVYSEGLTRTAIKKIYELHQTLNREIQAIISETEHHGDIPFFSFACMDQILESDT